MKVLFPLRYLLHLSNLGHHLTTRRRVAQASRSMWTFVVNPAEIIKRFFTHSPNRKQIIEPWVYAKNVGWWEEQEAGESEWVRRCQLGISHYLLSSSWRQNSAHPLPRRQCPRKRGTPKGTPYWYAAWEVRWKLWKEGPPTSHREFHNSATNAVLSIPIFWSLLSSSFLFAYC